MTLAELPLPLIPMTRSPISASISTCGAKMLAKSESLAHARTRGPQSAKADRAQCFAGIELNTLLEIVGEMRGRCGRSSITHQEQFSAGPPHLFQS